MCIAHSLLRGSSSRFPARRSPSPVSVCPASSPGRCSCSSCWPGWPLLLGVHARQVAVALVPIMAVALWVHLPNGWVRTSDGGGWEYPGVPHRCVGGHVASGRRGGGVPTLDTVRAESLDRPHKKESELKQALIPIAKVPESGAVLVDFFDRPALVYRAGGEVRATLAICPHLGGPLEWKDGELVCAWHGQRHDPASGRCLRGPAPGQQAMKLPTRVDDCVLHDVWESDVEQTGTDSGQPRAMPHVQRAAIVLAEKGIAFNGERSIWRTSRSGFCGCRRWKKRRGLLAEGESIFESAVIGEDLEDTTSPT